LGTGKEKRKSGEGIDNLGQQEPPISSLINGIRPKKNGEKRDNDGLLGVKAIRGRRKRGGL